MSLEYFGWKLCCRSKYDDFVNRIKQLEYLNRYWLGRKYFTTQRDLILFRQCYYAYHNNYLRRSILLRIQPNKWMQFVFITVLCFTVNNSIALFMQQVYPVTNFSSIFINGLTCWCLPFTWFLLSAIFYAFFSELQLTIICLLSKRIVIYWLCSLSTWFGKQHDLTHNINLLKQALADQILAQNWETLLTSTLGNYLSTLNGQDSE